MSKVNTRKVRDKDMKIKKIFTFSGQGSQCLNMGKNLYHSDAFFCQTVNKLDNIVKEMCNISIVDLFLNDNPMHLQRLLYSSPALFIIQYSAAELLIQKGFIPEFLLGSSLGEYVSISLAGHILPEDMVRLLIYMSRLIETRCSKGKMITIFDTKSNIEKYIDRLDDIEIISENFAGCFVVSGDMEQCGELKQLLRNNSIIFAELPVQYPFHTKLIDCIKGELMDFNYIYHQKKVNSPSIISSVSSTIVSEIDNRYIWEIIREPINLQMAIGNLELIQPHIYIDFSPTGTIGNFLLRNGVEENRVIKIFNVQGRAYLDIINNIHLI